MTLSGLLQRVLIGTRMQSTETVQRQIQTLLDGTGQITAQELYARIDLSVGAAQSQMMVDQAAQILVNTRIVCATQSQKPVDPINAGGDYTLTYVRSD